jgi:D-arabinose 1-dehydrogenase-like Zn-dependent alcohol dehydrogenase
MLGPDAARLRPLGPGIQTSADYAELNTCDWVIATSADPQAIELLLRQSAPGSSLLLLNDGAVGSRAVHIESLLANDKSVVGSVGSTRADITEALTQLASLDTEPLIGSSFPLEQFASAWQTARAKAIPKVMLQVDASAA